MILIGTSGSTKCDWQLIEERETILNLSSKGINPFFHSEEVIANHILAMDELKPYHEKIDVIFFYGAGCSSKEFKNLVQRGISSVFKRSNIYINHDIVAAAFATYEGVPAITGLIGTGANSCFFDGDIVRQEISGVDYILGDEGSGAFLGKRLLRDYMYELLPKELSRELEQNYDLDRHTIFENVYMKPYANVYLASFVPFIQERQDNDYLNGIVKDGLSEYMDLYIKPFRNVDRFKTHFVGSIPFYFKNILEKVAKEKEIQLGMIIKEPIERLVQYHINKYYKQ